MLGVRRNQHARHSPGHHHQPPRHAAGRSAMPVTKRQAPTTTKVSDITHRSAAPTAASMLTGSATGLTGRGCSPAATLHPATISTGAAADDSTPHHGTSRTINHSSRCYSTAPSSQMAAGRQPAACLTRSHILRPRASSHENASAAESGPRMPGSVALTPARRHRRVLRGPRRTAHHSAARPQCRASAAGALDRPPRPPARR